MEVKKGVKRTKNGLSLSKKEQETDQNGARFALPILTFEGRIAVSGPETGFGRPKSAIWGVPKKGRFTKVYIAATPPYPIESVKFCKSGSAQGVASR